MCGDVDAVEKSPSSNLAKPVRLDSIHRPVGSCPKVPVAGWVRTVGRLPRGVWAPTFVVTENPGNTEAPLHEPEYPQARISVDERAEAGLNSGGATPLAENAPSIGGRSHYVLQPVPSDYPSDRGRLVSPVLGDVEHSLRTTLSRRTPTPEWGRASTFPRHAPPAFGTLRTRKVTTIEERHDRRMAQILLIYGKYNPVQR